MKRNGGGEPAAARSRNTASPSRSGRRMSQTMASKAARAVLSAAAASSPAPPPSRSRALELQALHQRSAHDLVVLDDGDAAPGEHQAASSAAGAGGITRVMQVPRPPASTRRVAADRARLLGHHAQADPADRPAGPSPVSRKQRAALGQAGAVVRHRDGERAAVLLDRQPHRSAAPGGGGGVEQQVEHGLPHRAGLDADRRQRSRVRPSISGSVPGGGLRARPAAANPPDPPRSAARRRYRGGGSPASPAPRRGCRAGHARAARDCARRRPAGRRGASACRARSGARRAGC